MIALSSINDRIPGYTETKDALAAAKRLPFPLARAVSTEAQIAADIEHELRSGADLGNDELLSVAAKAMSEVDAVRVTRGAIVSLRERLRDELDNLYLSNPNIVLAGLNQALQERVAAVRRMRPLEEIFSESDALHSERAADYNRLQALGHDYRQIGPVTGRPRGVPLPHPHRSRTAGIAPGTRHAKVCMPAFFRGWP